MSLEKRIAAVEDRLIELQAIIDGCEMQAREATAFVISLVVQHLRKAGLIDEQALLVYLKTHEGDASDSNDYMGDQVRVLSSMIEFHRRYPDSPKQEGGRSDALMI